jgi:hypothetical protein
VRRRLREIVRLSAAAEGATGPDSLRPGHDYVLIGRRAALVLPFGEMMQNSMAESRCRCRENWWAQPALHEAGSPAKARKLRRSGRRPPESREQQRRSPRREP